MTFLNVFSSIFQLYDFIPQSFLKLLSKPLFFYIICLPWLFLKPMHDIPSDVTGISRVLIGRRRMTDRHMIGRVHLS